MRIFAISVSVFLFLSCSCFALEIRNARASANGNILQVTYDLLGKPGEKKANVKVAVILDGERYLPGVVNMVGDYGASTTVGLGKKISWNLLKDMPAGYKGMITWELDADSEVSDDPFNLLGLKNKVKPPVVTDKTVADPKSKLIWTRSPLSVKQIFCVDDASSVVRKMNQTNYSGYNDWRLPKKDEFESLIKMIENYGYKTGQSTLPYLSRIGFEIDRESKFWTIDKSSSELSGRDVYISASGNYGSGGSTSSSSSRYSRTSSYNSGGSAAYSASVGVKQRAADSGLYDVILNTKDGYFYKHNGSEAAIILAVRGDSHSDIFAVSLQSDVSITP